jgi:predicted O-linked N-acetylglucosamine transferase (SPINDLY family)
MTKTSLYKSIQAHLDQEHYEEAIAYLNEVIKKDLNNVEAYYLLGLVYVLLGQDELSQEYWLAGMLAQSENSTGISLQEILEDAATQQEIYHRFDLTLRIREHILGLTPEDLDNKLQIISLALRLGNFTPEYMASLSIIDELKIQENIENSSLLLECILGILAFPTLLSLDFLEASLAHLKNEDWLNPVMNLANYMAYDRKMVSYAIDIAKICLVFSPNNFYILNSLLQYYGLKKDQFKILETARYIRDLLNSNNASLPFICYLLSRLILSFLQGNDWSEVDIISAKFQSHLNLLLKQENITLDEFLSGRFWAIGFPLLYLMDDPQQIRGYLNQTAQIFQEDVVRRRISVPVASFNAVSASSTNIKPFKSLRRIGYIAHTLRQHSVGWLCRWLFRYHDRSQYEIYVYLIGQPVDELTEKWIYPNVDVYHHFERDVANIVEQIREDQIQILVDLDVLTHNITAQVLAHKPAPVQISWLGSDASGLPSIDYFIVDPYVVAEDAQYYYQEKLWRLPNTYLAVDGFEIGSSTLTRDNLGVGAEKVIYLSIQNKIKSNPRILKLQLQIVQSVPNSLFFIKGGGDNDLIHEMVAQLAQEVGLDMQRVRFLHQDIDEMTHRANLEIADVVLDTYPYNGATTTLETLWMGIPIVTRVGQQFAARNSYTFLMNVGVTEGIAWTDAEYVDWGIKLGQDKDLREQVKAQLLAARQHSPLWRAEEFTREMEKGFCQIWKETCHLM